MAYTKTTWNTGDTITAEKLNHMEDGIDSANNSVMIVSALDDNGTPYLNKTYSEILTALKKGTSIYIAVNINEDSCAYYMIYECQKQEPDNYIVTAYNLNLGASAMFSASTPNDYPIQNNEG